MKPRGMGFGIFSDFLVIYRNLIGWLWHFWGLFGISHNPSHETYHVRRWSPSSMRRPRMLIMSPNTNRNQSSRSTYWYRTFCDISHTNWCLLYNVCLMSCERENINGWKLMKMDENGWKWLKMDEIGWKWLKMDENGWKWTKTDKNGWK